MSDTSTNSPRVGKVLHDVTRPFAEESVARSWWHVGSTFLVLGATARVAGRKLSGDRGEHEEDLVLGDRAAVDGGGESAGLGGEC